MSWLFGSMKKKEPPHVTIDPTPIDGFCVVQKVPSQQPVPSMYPNLNPVSPSSLPYSPSPYLPNTSATTSTTLPLRSGGGNVLEVHNQLDSVPFRIASHLELDSNLNSNNNNIVLKEFIDRLKRVKQGIENGEFDYDFKLERNIIREAKMVNGHIAY